MEKEKYFLTGASGFVGRNVLKLLENCHVSVWTRNSDIKIDASVVIHLAGKAHDLKNTSFSNQYYRDNTELTKVIYDAFLDSEARVFITLSSVKAVADNIGKVLTEEDTPNPLTDYGKSKLLAERYILSQLIPDGKRVYILRPCMIHGPENKGNLNILYRFVSKGLPWPLGAFENKRSFCSIDNLLFVIKELICREDIKSGIYNIADDDSLSTNSVISILAQSQNISPKIWSIPKPLIQFCANIGDLLKLPLNNERLSKLTESYEVSNFKIKQALGKSLPVSSKDGLLKTFQSFQ